MLDKKTDDVKKPLFKTQFLKKHQDVKHLKHKFFLNDNNRNLFAISLLVLITIALILLVITVNLKTIGILDTNQLFEYNWTRAVQMLLTGFSLGVASYLLQRITMNRLADTAVMGFGNFNLIALIIMCLPSITDFKGGQSWTIERFNLMSPWVLIGSSILITLAFNFFARDKVKFNFAKLLVAGVILNFVSISIALSVRNTLDYKANGLVMSYIIGHINGSISLYNLYIAVGVIIFATAWIMLHSYRLKLIILNQDIAKQVGIHSKTVILQIMIAIGLLVGASYEMSGDVVFVGLIAGNIAFSISKNKIHYGVLTSGLLGAIMVLLAFFVFENLIGVDTAIIPLLIPITITPYFLYILIRWK